MEKLKVYISGPITDNPHFKEDFAEAEEILKAFGFDVVNPAKEQPEGWTWVDYMKRDLKQLLDCDAIYLIKGFEKSKGSMLELRISKALKMKWITENMEIFSEFPFRLNN